MKTHKKELVMALMAAFIVIGMAAGRPPRGSHENLKVLPKDISNADLDTVMIRIERALGVECNFCHVKSKQDTAKWDYASDEKPEKEITRKMLKMTETINHEFFDYKITYKQDEILAVSCRTCHHGHPRPELAEEN